MFPFPTTFSILHMIGAQRKPPEKHLCDQCRTNKASTCTQSDLTLHCPLILFQYITRQMFDAKRQREAAMFRCTCRNKKKGHLNPQTLEQFKL